MSERRAITGMKAGGNNRERETDIQTEAEQTKETPQTQADGDIADLQDRH